MQSMSSMGERDCECVLTENIFLLGDVRQFLKDKQSGIVKCVIGTQQSPYNEAHRKF